VSVGDGGDISSSRRARRTDGIAYIEFRIRTGTLQCIASGHPDEIVQQSGCQSAYLGTRHEASLRSATAASRRADLSAGVWEREGTFRACPSASRRVPSSPYSHKWCWQSPLARCLGWFGTARGQICLAGRISVLLPPSPSRNGLVYLPEQQACFPTSPLLTIFE